MTSERTKMPAAALARFIAAGLSCREIAARLGVSPATAVRWTKRCGLTSQRSRRLAPETRRRLALKLEAGLSPSDAAREVGVSPRTASRLVDPGAARRRRAARRASVVRAILAGASLRDAAVEAGVSASTAGRWAREAGLPRPRVRKRRQAESQAFAAIEAGMNADEAASKFALGPLAIERLARRFTPERTALRKRLFAAIASGLSLRKAAAAVEMPIATAIRWARRAGAAPSLPGRAK